MSIKSGEQPSGALHLYLLLAAGVLLAVMIVAAVRAYRTPWRAYQAEFHSVAKNGKRTPIGIQQYATCDGEVDRCPTCHLGIERKELAGEEIAQPFRAHGPGIGKHRPVRVGCSACHGGNGRALDIETAHASSTYSGRDSLMKQPHIQASCVKCHVPGSQQGQDRLVQGAELYLGLGCAICHPLTEGGRGGFDYGPDLATIGRRSLNYLEMSLVDPTANFPDSTMPSFRLSLKKDAAAKESLLIYLQSLVLGRLSDCAERGDNRGEIVAPCATCHAGKGGKASGRIKHRCVFLLKRAGELVCESCHASKIPEPGAGDGFCPLVAKHRAACSACHDGV